MQGCPTTTLQHAIIESLSVAQFVTEPFEFPPNEVGRHLKVEDDILLGQPESADSEVIQGIVERLQRSF